MRIVADTTRRRTVTARQPPVHLRPACATRLIGGIHACARMAERTLISIVCAVYNEEVCIPIFYDRVRASLEPLRDRYDFELLFTNNCSTDGSLETILRLRRNDPRVQVITYTRNYGYEASIATGLRHARGNAIVAIDVDCQDPPEMIPQFVAEWERGYDVVYGKREQRLEFVGMQLARKAFYRLHRLIADSEIVLDMGEFYLVSAPVRDAMLLNRSTKPFLRSEVAYVGFRRTGIAYTRQHRAAGMTHHKLLRATEFAVAGIVTSSTFPLRLSVYCFPALAIVNLVLLYGDRFQGLVAVDLLYLAFFLSMACIYLARTYTDVIQRPDHGHRLEAIGREWAALSRITRHVVSAARTRHRHHLPGPTQTRGAYSDAAANAYASADDRHLQDVRSPAEQIRRQGRARAQRRSTSTRRRTRNCSPSRSARLRRSGTAAE